MPFWVHGRDEETGERTDRLVVDGDSEEEARRVATEQGLIVDSVERFEVEEEANSEPPRRSTEPGHGVRGCCCAAVVGAILLALLGLLPGPAPEVVFQHLPPDVLTTMNERTFAERSTEWRLETSLEAYERLGTRDPRWDAGAVALLREYGKDRVRRMKLSQAEFLERAVSLIDEGCEDPLILYLAGKASFHTNPRGTESVEYLVRAYQGMQSRGYPFNRQLGALHYLSLSHRKLGNKGVAANYEAELLQLLVNGARRDDLSEAEERLFAMSCGYSVALFRVEDLHKLRGELESLPDRDTWLCSFLLGECDWEEGWLVRGTGLAHTVSEERWERFEAFMARARHWYTRAHELNPTFPIAASRLIDVERSVGEFEEVRHWFRIAVTAEFDFMRAYDAYRFALEPKWLGSEADQYNFGFECLMTDRFDTRVPYEFDRIYKKLSRSSSGKKLLKENREIVRAHLRRFEERTTRPK